MQFGKTVSVSRRTLPTILPKTVSSLQKSPVRKLPSILPAPVKCTVSTITRPVVSGLVTSSQVAIPTSLHPPQSLKSGLSGTVTKSSSTISVATKRKSETKRCVLFKCFLNFRNDFIRALHEKLLFYNFVFI